MKKIISVFASLLVLICFFSCSNPSSPLIVPTPMEETYTVYVNSVTYSFLHTQTGVVFENKSYYRYEFTKSQYNEILSSSGPSTDMYKRQWTKSQIKDWLLGHYLDETDATRVSSWLVTIDHGVIFIRWENMVYCILK